MLLRTLHRQYIRAVAGAIWTNEALLFYPALRRFYQQAFAQRPAATVVDIGANRGQSIRFFKKLFPKARIVAFEPNPRLMQILRSRFTDDTITLLQQGVSHATSSLPFYEHALDETSSFTPPAAGSSYAAMKNRVLLTHPDRAIRAVYEVPVVRLDDFWTEAYPPLIDILKVDVEGHEAEVLQGAAGLLASGRVRLVQLEQHEDDQYDPGNLRPQDLLQQHGYTPCFRKKHGFGNFYEVVYQKSNG